MGQGNTTARDHGAPREDRGPKPDFSIPPVSKKLPESIQATLNDEQKMWELEKPEKPTSSTDSNVRYAAYASRLRTILISAQRYVAYTSDIGESFRPVAHPYLVRGAYGVSWAYLTGDVAYEGYKAYQRNQQVLHPERYANKDKQAASEPTISASAESSSVAKTASMAVEKAKTVLPSGQSHYQDQLKPGKVPAIDDYRAVMVKRALFQGIASMGLPAFTIHSIVRYSGRAMKNVKNTKIRTWGPIGLGLAAVPFLPYLFDRPVEEALEWTFHKSFEAVGGPEAVGHRQLHAKPVLKAMDSKATGNKEKEL
jgi:fission process protein 1